MASPASPASLASPATKRSRESPETLANREKAKFRSEVTFQEKKVDFSKHSLTNLICHCLEITIYLLYFVPTFTIAELLQLAISMFQPVCSPPEKI